eukprot:NODE_774_length_4360_cov_0.289134.p2 type:complete len:200 gc:universal NODE_774_length_4360_cov_0.289134:861-1460(+)
MNLDKISYFSLMLRAFTRNFNQDSLSGKYATALFRAGVSQKQSSSVTKDVLDLHSKLQKDEQARIFLENPTFPIKDKQKWLSDASDKFKYNKLTKSFLELVVEHKREVMLEKILSQYVSYVQKNEGIVEVNVTSPSALSQKDLDLVKSKLAKIVKGTIKIGNTVNSDILGGIVVEFGDYLIDLSVTDKINQVKQVILAQ